MSLGLPGGPWRWLAGVALVALALSLGLQVVDWWGGGRLRPDPGWIKAGMVFSVLAICVAMVAKGLASDGEVTPETAADSRDEPR